MEKRSELTGRWASWSLTSFVYTTPKKNLNASNYTGGLEQFANDLDTFASSMNDFYGRDDEDGKHRMFTYKT